MYPLITRTALCAALTLSLSAVETSAAPPKKPAAKKTPARATAAKKTPPVKKAPPTRARRLPPRPPILKTAKAGSIRQPVPRGGRETDIGDSRIPSAPASGRVYGEPFAPDRAEFWNRSLTLRQGGGLVPERDIRILIPLR